MMTTRKGLGEEGAKEVGARDEKLGRQAVGKAFGYGRREEEGPGMDLHRQHRFEREEVAVANNDLLLRCSRSSRSSSATPPANTSSPSAYRTLSP
jgi:hypothetical protein